MNMFRYPPFFSYPPSFTLQPVKATREKQQSLWCELVLSYCRHHKVFKLSCSEATHSALFSNLSIDRKLSREAIREIFSYMVSKGYGEWLNKERDVCLIFWRRPKEWAQLIYAWVELTGRRKSILTLYEIRFSEETRETDFYDMDYELLLKCLQILESEGKCAIFESKVSDELVSSFRASDDNLS
eukprot:jgi/Galph1/803/GphlegSOOS_G5445.1